MRDIKFRAWCDDQKRMFTKVIIGNTSCPESDDYTAHCIFRDGEWYHSDEHDNVTFEQYTGLKDHSGSDVFEGDIVQFEQDDIDYFFVVSMDERGCFVAHNEVDSSDFYHLDDFDYLVIGNIHQNPELLK